MDKADKCSAVCTKHTRAADIKKLFKDEILVLESGVKHLNSNSNNINNNNNNEYIYIAQNRKCSDALVYSR